MSVHETSSPAEHKDTVPTGGAGVARLDDPLNFGGYARDDLRGQFNAMIDGIGRLSAIAQFNDQYNEAAQTIRKKCGSCVFWMCLGNCPREQGLGSKLGGPSSGSPACHKFEMNGWVIDLYQKRMAAVHARADQLGLPRPPIMQVGTPAEFRADDEVQNIPFKETK